MPETLVKEYEALWSDANAPPDVFIFLSQQDSSCNNERLAVLLMDQRKRWHSHQPINVEEYLHRLPELSRNPDSKLQLAANEFVLRQKFDQWPNLHEFLARFSDISESLKLKLIDEPTMTAVANSSAFDKTISCVVADAELEIKNIGRYRILRILGAGAFGVVYLGFDDELQRSVAVKVPNPDRLQNPGDADAFLAEARTLASLDHPNIVPVYDLGRTDDGSLYVVSRYIQGQTLSEQIHEVRLEFPATARLLAKVAVALHYAHQHRVIHRDIKPSNLLLETESGIPYVADFGLALRNNRFLMEGKVVGTPSYMSPEQARGETHRLDGRSDIFALGAILYLMLTGRKAFPGSTYNEILHAVTAVEPPAPRDIDLTIPVQLERICLKAMSKRISERYVSAAEFAEDLMRWQQMPEQPNQNQQLIPRGLRSFDASDANVFLELLPGLRNQDGLPESIHFWKIRLEARDPETTFSVGLIYGPSGCGKSSLVKAGLLPRLDHSVCAIYLEATPTGLESAILRAVRKRFQDLSRELDLVQTLQLLRNENSCKVVLIIDQFEQWLHTNLADPDNTLISALRQCDGGSLQAVVMVRDDFAMAAARFMDSLEIPILQGHNFDTIDLFEEQHAVKVLSRFGQAFGKLPAKKNEFSQEQNEFVTSVVKGLSSEGKVVPVRLALFADMIRTKPWRNATLAEVGGTAGIGVNFLEDTFSGRSANPKHLQHQQAARLVLNTLLPEVGSNIKGHMKSQAELLEVSGYQQQPNRFNELLRILDGELRLITPTDPDNVRSDSGSYDLSKNFQLTHDYLVPALRKWLTRKQSETKQGRMELLLQERTSLWAGRREQKQLPSFFEWQGIFRFTTRSSWSPAGVTMMQSATRLYVSRLLTWVSLLALLSFVGFFVQGQIQRRASSTQITNRLDDLWQARVEHVPEILTALAPDRAEWIDRARDMADDTNSPVAARTRAMLTLSETDGNYMPWLINRLLECDSDEHRLLRNGLAKRQQEIAELTWSKLSSSEVTRAQAIRAGVTLAQFSPAAAQWEFFGQQLADAIIRSEPFESQPWLNGLAPIRRQLMPHLLAISLDDHRLSGQRSRAAGAIASFSELDSEFPEAAELLELVLASDAAVRSALESAATRRSEDLLPLLKIETDVQLEQDRIAQDQHVVNRKAAAIEQSQRLGHDAPFWQHLNDEKDPRVRTVLINDFALPLLSWDDIQQHLRSQPARCRQAILLGIPQRLTLLTTTQRDELKSILLQLYRTDPDAGVHSAVEYVLRITAGDATVYGAQFQMSEARAKAGNWSVLSNGICMVSLDRPGLVSFGSDLAKATANDSPSARTVTIDYPFEISATEITVRQFHQFRASIGPALAVTPSADCPMNSVNLFQAMQFCRWLSEQDPDFDAKRCVYPPVDTIGDGLLLAPDYQRWPGFRLPTVDEWEYAVRAGTTTNRFFGSLDDQLNEYSWWVFNSQERLWPVGMKRPNPFGLFDVYGNVGEWCHDAGTPFNSNVHQNRGGEYRSTQRFLNSFTGTPTNSLAAFSTTGFRIVRIKESH